MVVALLIFLFLLRLVGGTTTTSVAGTVDCFLLLFLQPLLSSPFPWYTRATETIGVVVLLLLSPSKNGRSSQRRPVFAGTPVSRAGESASSAGERSVRPPSCFCWIRVGSVDNGGRLPSGCWCWCWCCWWIPGMPAGGGGRGDGGAG